MKRKKSLTALLLASTALVMLPGCSTTEEAPPPAAPEAEDPTVEVGDQGIPCDIDPMQEGCL